jgi:hypothetical protein
MFPVEEKSTRLDNLHKLGMQLCALAMLIALGAGGWGYFIQPSALVFAFAALAAGVGLVGIGLLAFDFFFMGNRRKSE